MDLTENSHKKQIVGIIFVVVFLLIVCVYGSRDHRKASRGSAVTIKDILAPVETVQAEKTVVPLQAEAVR